MRTCFRFRKISLGICLLAASAAALLAVNAEAQTLARPGWAGSGLTPEPWWRHAVIYRLDDAKLPTLTQLPSFQAFGIDALMLTPQAMPQTQEPVADAAADAPLTVDDLLFECSRLRIRVLVPLDVTTGAENVMALARSWLYRGAAGFVLVGVDKLPKAAADSANAVTAGPVHLHRGAGSSAIHLATISEPELVTNLHKLVAATAGERILVGAEAGDAPAALPSLQLQIVSLGAEPANDLQIAAKLATFSTMTSPRALLEMQPTASLSPVSAAFLLATDQPAILDSSLLSSEMLTKVFPPLAKAVAPDAPAAVASPPPPPPPENVYGSFHEYVRKPDNSAAERKRKAEAEKAEKDAADIAFATFPIQPMYQAMSDTPEGLVAFYHRLVQLHRSNDTMREGTLFGLHPEPPKAVAWVALHAGSAPVLVVCNPTDAALKLDVSADLRKLRMSRNESRTLLHTGAASAMETDTAIGVPAHGVYVGELARGYSYK